MSDKIERIDVNDIEAMRREFEERFGEYRGREDDNKLVFEHGGELYELPMFFSLRVLRELRKIEDNDVPDEQAFIALVEAARMSDEMRDKWLDLELEASSQFISEYFIRMREKYGAALGE
ncbi:hypothetical protein [Leucobacter sp. OH1287]|uniref:hypothetical protein n=1 Tax=Leucobacter sp. OH1287 TaxID=2491049 RepID=UPI000F5F24C7|nr:hypothetical protein [Leucobacter sp. OH1287]RRD61629.1 hypothetical protein EII30_02035 [Leucobacter sp. OH1287]